MKVFRVICPLIPLFPDGQKYEENYQLPLRQRPQHSLNIPYLTCVLRGETIYEQKDSKTDLAVVGTLSPYSLLTHVMIIELSPNRYLPGPTSFDETEFSKITKLAIRIIDESKTNEHTIQCVGYNWSQNSWGTEEEKGGCQSLMTKFHLMIWQWNNVSLENINDIPDEHKRIFQMNDYNVPFAKLLYGTINELITETNLFDEPIYGPRGLLLPFKIKNDPISEFLIKDNLLLKIAESIEKVIYHIDKCLVYDSIEEVKNILMKTEDHVLNEEEINDIRKNPNPRKLEEALSLCINDNEKDVIKAIYESVKNRADPLNLKKPIWKKWCGYSLVVVDSRQKDVCQSGLYINFHPFCGPGGVAEALGCYLTRTEKSLASEEVMLKHNHLLWELSARLYNNK